MARIVADRGIDIAQTVITLANMGMDDTPEDFYYTGVTRNQTTGYHIVNVIGDRRVSILNHPSTEGFILVYGYGADFDYPECFARESATRVRFEIDELNEGGKAVRDWLVDGTMMYPDVGRVEL